MCADVCVIAARRKTNIHAKIMAFCDERSVCVQLSIVGVEKTDIFEAAAAAAAASTRQTTTFPTTKKTNETLQKKKMSNFFLLSKCLVLALTLSFPHAHGCTRPMSLYLSAPHDFIKRVYAHEKYEEDETKERQKIRTTTKKEKKIHRNHQLECERRIWKICRYNCYYVIHAYVCIHVCEWRLIDACVGRHCRNGPTTHAQRGILCINIYENEQNTRRSKVFLFEIFIRCFFCWQSHNAHVMSQWKMNGSKTTC